MLREGDEAKLLEGSAKVLCPCLRRTPERADQRLVEVASPDQRLGPVPPGGDTCLMVVEDAAELVQLAVGQSPPVGPGSLPRKHRAGDEHRRRPHAIKFQTSQAERFFGRMRRIPGRTDSAHAEVGPDAGPTLLADG